MSTVEGAKLAVLIDADNASFRAACNRFIFFEVLRPSSGDPPDQPKVDAPSLQDTLARAVAATSRDTGSASLSAVGSYIAKNDPSFDTRLYGSAKLSELVRKQSYLKVKETVDASGFTHLAIRRR